MKEIVGSTKSNTAANTLHTEASRLTLIWVEQKNEQKTEIGQYKGKLN